MALFDRSKLPNEMIVRPSGIWNSRAPFHTFMKINKADTRAYEITRLCLERITFDLPIAREGGKTLEEFMVPKNDIARRSWKNYAKAYIKRNKEGKIQSPAYGHVKHDLVMSQEILKYSTLIRSMTLFESYINCWLINYLLSKLELGLMWDRDERAFARQLSPVHGEGTPPSIHKILTSVDTIRNTLKELWSPDLAVQGTHKKGYSYLDHLFFWVHYRNCVVHNGGLCTPRVYNRHANFWLDTMAELSRDRFEERLPLTLSFELLYRCRYTIYKSVSILESRLEEISKGRRGHPWAPDPRPVGEVVPPKDAPPLLMEGDHALSLTWHSDASFRSQFQIVDVPEPSVN